MKKDSSLCSFEVESRFLDTKLSVNIKLQVGAVVISPTRELARQIHEVMHPFAASLPWLRTSLLVGGT